MTFDIPLS